MTVKTLEKKFVFLRPPLFFGSAALICLCPFPEDGERELAEMLLGPEELAESRHKTSYLVYTAFMAARLAAKAAYLKARGENFSPEACRARLVLKDSLGAPGLFDPRNGFLGHISLSHSQTLAGAIYSPEGPVGFDLEKKSRPLKKKLLDFVFSSGEKSLAESSGAWPGFLALWAAKEAAAKSWGLGLLNHLGEVRVRAADFARGLVRVEKEAPGVSSSRREALVHLSLYGDWLLACAGRPTP